MVTRGRGFAPFTQATYRITIQDRETGRPVPGCSLTSGEARFGRKYRGISQAAVTVPQRTCSCDCIVDDGSQELAFYRSDSPAEPAWIGPVARLTDDPETGDLTIAAFDRLYWAEGAPASRPIRFSTPNEIDVVDLAELLLIDAERYEPTGLLRGFRGVTGQTPPKSGLKIEQVLDTGESIWSVFDRLSRTSLAYSVVGRNLYWGSPRIPIDEGPRILSTHWRARPSIERNLSRTATRVRVTGSNNVVGEWPPTTEDEVPRGSGRRTLFFTNSQLNSQDEATTAAREIYFQNSGPSDFIVTGSNTLDESFPHGMEGLVPGRLYPVEARATCLETSELLELVNVSVRIEAQASPAQVWKEAGVAADFQEPGTSATSTTASV